MTSNKSPPAHTPGAWKYSLNVGPTKALIVEEDGSTVLELNNRVCDTRFEANARLIAAAPELVEALEKVMEWISNWNPNFEDDAEWPADRDKARAAIAKARAP